MTVLQSLVADWLFKEDHGGRGWLDDMFGEDTLPHIIEIYEEKAGRLLGALNLTPPDVEGAVAEALGVEASLAEALKRARNLTTLLGGIANAT